MEWNVDMGPNAIFFFLPPRNGPWLLFDPGVELQKAQVSFRQCGQQRVSVRKGQKGKQLIPPDSKLSVKRGVCL